MKIRIVLPLLFAMVNGWAQNVLNKTVPVQSNQKIEMHFDHPQLVRLTTWDKNEISIQALVSINNGENDDAFVVEASTNANVITIKNEIKNLKSIPHRITIKNGLEKILFKNQEEFKKYQQQNGVVYDRITTGIDMDITLDIKIPRNTETTVTSLYGMVEVINFCGPLKVESTYGGIDASLNEKTVGQLVAKTNFGEILTNLDVKFEPNEGARQSFHTHVSASIGAGPNYYFESKYGKVYLRKQ